MEKTTQTTLIPKYEIEYLKKAIEKLNRKARKLGCEEMVLTFADAEPFKTDRHPVTGWKLQYEMVIERVEATLTYIIPNIDGWELIARMDIFQAETGEREVMISAVPGKEIPEAYQNLDRIHCDHCGQNRRRNHSILIRNMESGEYMQVGSTCVKDFFNGNDPQGAMFLASLIFGNITDGISDEESFGNGYNSFSGFGLNEVLCLTAASIKKYGWMSKTKAEMFNRGSTADHVLNNLMPYPKMPKDEFVTPDEEDHALVEKAIEYFANIDTKGNDYLLNCQKLTKLNFVPFKFVGYACSMVSSYQREMNLIAKRKAKSDGTVSNHVGALGERLKAVPVVVVFAKEIATDWGGSTLYTFKDAAGNIFKTFYSGGTWSFDQDDKLIIDGTVKKHDEFRGEKQTMLNRVSAKKAPSEAFAADEFAVA